MKRLIALTVLIAATQTFAATPAAIRAAVDGAAFIQDIDKIEVLENDRCFDCSTIRISGNGFYGPAVVKLKTARTSANDVTATIVESSK